MEQSSKKRTCAVTGEEFEITADDLAFYEKIGVPVPQCSFNARRQRRLAWYNNINLHHRECGMCGDRVISTHAENNGTPIYCVKCWWSDNWDAMDYGRDFDFNRPFFEQFQELQREVPNLALINDNGIGSSGCEYTQNLAISKDCYMVFVCWKMENCLYGRYGTSTKDTMEFSSTWGGNELVYEAVDFQSCYNCRNIYYSSGCNDSKYLYDCRGCSDCFMCLGLRNEQYCFKNQKYSKDEYEKLIAEYDTSTWEGTKKAERAFKEFIADKPRRYANFLNCVDCTGNDLTNGKASKWCFNLVNVENCKFFENGDTVKDSYDCLTGGECELCYESITPDNSRNSLFTIMSWKNHDVAYCENVHSSEYMFGCSGVKKGSYCILNKKYSKEEYESLRKKIIEHMKETGEWGEFFPASKSYFGYNETLAQVSFPLSREEALKQGFKWQDELKKPTGGETVAWADFPASVHDTEYKHVEKEVFACEDCDRNYRVVEQEFQLYKKMNIPVPHRCFQCRLAKRLEYRNPVYLWKRTTEDGVEVMTPYSPDRPEKILSEEGYKQEML